MLRCHDQPHGDMEPVEIVLVRRVKICLKVLPRLAAVFGKGSPGRRDLEGFL